MSALVAGVGAHDGKAAYQSRFVSGGIQTQWRQYNAIAATSALHQEIAIPFLRHGQCEGDTELLSANSGSAIDHPLYATVRG